VTSGAASWPEAVGQEPGGGSPSAGCQFGTGHEDGQLAGFEIEAEQGLLDLVERGLRDEARRYGVDLDGWEIR
jgi:hypothetical protein